MLNRLSVWWHMIPLKFSRWNIYFEQKEPMEVKFLDFWVVRWKFTKFLMSYFKPQISFHQTLHYSSLPWEWEREVSRNLYFDRILLLKVYEIPDWKVQRSYVSWHWRAIHWRVIQNLKKSWYLVSKTTKIWWIFTQVLESLKKLHFDWILLCKVHNIWPKKVKRNYLSWHWRVMQTLNKNWLVVWRPRKVERNYLSWHWRVVQMLKKKQLLLWKMTWEIWQIFTRAKVSKLGFYGILLYKVENVWA